MRDAVVVLGVLAAVGGLAGLAVGVRASHGGAVDAIGWLHGAGPFADLAADGTERPAAIAWRQAVHDLGATLRRLSPASHLDRVHARLLRAGMASSVTAEEVLVANLFTAIGFPAIALVVTAVFGMPARQAVLVVVAAAVAGVIGPLAWLDRRGRDRASAIRRDLPDVLDLLAISMEAGLAFDGAVQTVVDRMSGPLADELRHLLTEMELGLPRRDALQNLRRRNDVPELASVIVALVQADTLGMPVGRVLRVQAGEMRQKRRQWARERAAKLPVKIVFPLVLFIFPPVMIVILGPVAPSLLQIM